MTDPMPSGTPKPGFDSNRAWQEALALIRSNREVLLALAGVFVVLPAFALAVLAPPPAPKEGATVQAMLATLGDYYREAAPALIGAALVHMAGTLAMLALFTDTSRPTVGQAIKLGFARMPTVIAAQLILGAAVGAMLLVPVTLGSMAGAPGLMGLGVVAAAGLGAWAWTRLSLIAPVAMVESDGNPLSVIRRSWTLTEGNAMRLFAFYVLLGVAFMVSMLVIEGVVNILLSMVLGSEGGAMAGTFVATCIQAGMTVCFTAVIAASHRQLSQLS